VIAKKLLQVLKPATGGGGGAFTPTQLTGLQRWYSATDIVTSGSNVTQFNDKSGGGNHATQATSTKQPVLKTNQGSGFQTVSFDGVDDIVSFASMTLTGDFTVYWVGFMREADSAGGAFFGESETSQSSLNTFNQGTYWYTSAGDIVQGNNSVIASGMFCEVVARRTGTTVTVEVNTANGSTSGPANANPVIGQIGKAFSGYSKHDLAEFLVYSQYHDNATKAQVLSWADQTYVAPYPLSPPSPNPALWLNSPQKSSLFTDAGVTNVTTNGQSIYQWNDLSGNNRHAVQTTLANRPTWVAPPDGRNGLGAVAFNGSQIIGSSNAGSVSFGTGDFTVEGWIKPSSFSGNNILLYSGNGGFLLYFNSSGLFKVSNWGVADYITTSTAISTTNWTHFAVTRASGTLRLFLNGSQTNSVSNSVNFSPSTFLLGWDNNASNPKYVGQIQNLLIYNNQALYTSNFTPWMS
jgi:hypothetical protein